MYVYTTFCISIYELMGIWVASTFWLKGTWEREYIKTLISILSDIYPGIYSPGLLKNPCLEGCGRLPRGISNSVLRGNQPYLSFSIFHAKIIVFSKNLEFFFFNFSMLECSGVESLQTASLFHLHSFSWGSHLLTLFKYHPNSNRP